MAPVISPDGKTLFVCNRFDNDVSVIDLKSHREVRRVAVQREPAAAAFIYSGNRGDMSPGRETARTSHDGSGFLLVANHLPNGRADREYSGAVISVVDPESCEVIKELALPRGSGGLKEIRVSPDGAYAVVTHVVARFDRSTTHLTYGWMNANAMTIIDLSRLELYNTVILDNLERGAANPWGIAWSADGAKLVVTHAGTHEISVIDFPLMMSRLLNVRAAAEPVPDPNTAFRLNPALADDLPFLTGARRRIKLPEGDLGPRAAAVMGDRIYVANYFSDTLTIVDLAYPEAKPASIRLGPKISLNEARQGEFYFHDATICYQSWQSCASCHPDGRADGINWDLLNDGMNNPKNTRSLLLAHQTPPAMSLGVRDTADKAVRAGIRHILFSVQPEETGAAINAYLTSLKPVPSPHLVRGTLSKSAQRGARVFTRAGCAECHPPGLFTNLRSYDVGTRNKSDKPTDVFDTPTLVELWRTAPYLHDGSAATVRDVVTACNPQDQHGVTSNLSEKELSDLCEYLLSL